MPFCEKNNRYMQNKRLHFYTNIQCKRKNQFSIIVNKLD